MKDEINVTIRKSDLKKMLKNVIQHSQSTLISEVIVENLAQSECGLVNMFHAFNGINPELADFNLKVGDMIPVKWYGLSTWDWDEQAMKNAQILLDGTVECHILGYDNTKTHSIHVEYIFIDKSGEKKKTDYWIEPSDIKTK